MLRSMIPSLTVGLFLFGLSSTTLAQGRPTTPNGGPSGSDTSDTETVADPQTWCCYGEWPGYECERIGERDCQARNGCGDHDAPGCYEVCCETPFGYRMMPAACCDCKEGGTPVPESVCFGAAEVELTIHMPAVLDDQQSPVADAIELSEGSQTFVNLDNDDNDDKFDLNDQPVNQGDNELVMLKIELSDPNAPGKVELTGIGSTSIRIWEESDKTGGSYTLPHEFETASMKDKGIPGLKELWIEGIQPHTNQREVQIQASWHNSTDEVALTVIGVEKLEWIGLANSRNDDDTLDADPNWPTGLDPGSVRVFSGARAVGGVVQGARDQVYLNVKLSTAVVKPLDMFVKSFDVDDPTDDKWPVDGVADDPYGTNARGEDAPEDNRNDPQAPFGIPKSGKFAGTPAPPPYDKLSRVQFKKDEKENAIGFRVTMHPGDNFRTAAYGDPEFLLSLQNDDRAEYYKSHAQRQMICDPRIEGDTALQKQILQPDQYASNVLTVWRFLHCELDAMIPVTPEANVLRGYFMAISGTGTKCLALPMLVGEQLEVLSLDDGSPNLNSTPRGYGRFQDGELIVGKSPSTVTVKPLFGNGKLGIVLDPLSGSPIVPLPFTAESTGTPTETMQGTITEIEYTGTPQHPWVYTVSVVGTNPPNWDSFINGYMFVGGSDLPSRISDVNRTQGTITSKDVLIPFELRDDDDNTVLDVGNDPFPDFTSMQAVYAPAYILPVNDGGTHPANNKQNINFLLNNIIVPGGGGMLHDLFKKQDTPLDDELDEFWVVYVGSAFQPVTDMDGDPHGPLGVGEQTRFGMTPSTIETNNHILTPGGHATFVYKETIREGLPVTGDSEALIVAHEVGHQFGLGHLPGSLMRPNSGLSQTPDFDVLHLNLLRSRVKSPGME